MTKHNADNERIKRQYFAFLKEAKRHSEPTVNASAKALNRFEVYTKHRDFRTFHIEQAIAFKKHLAQQNGQQSGEKLSKATLYAALAQLKRFFQWLACQPGYKSRFQYCDAEYFNLSDKDTRIATAQREQKAPTLEQVKHVINTMPASTEIQRRNRALIAFTLLTGARKLWSNDDPLFPATRVALGAARQFEVLGLERDHWRSASPIRTIFRKAFVNAGLPYFNPHSFRNTLVQLGQDVCKSPEQFKAWSQNLGHEKVLTTFLSYGEVACPRQGQIIRALATLQEAGQTNADEIVEALFRKFRASGVDMPVK